MLVTLLKDVLEQGKPKMAYRPGRTPVLFIAGATIEMSDASAAKYVEAGLAKPCDESQEEAA